MMRIPMRSRDRARRARGLSLVELMIALVLSSMVAAAILMLTRAQLRAFEANDHVTRTQQNARAGINYVETLFRRACSGVSSGALGFDVSGQPQGLRQCIRIFDGAVDNGTGSFTSSSPTTLPDAVEVAYASGAVTNCVASISMMGASPSCEVADTTGFLVGDLVLVTPRMPDAAPAIAGSAPAGGWGWAFQGAVLMRISSVSPTTAPRGTIAFGNIGAAITQGVNAPPVFAPTFEAFDLNATRAGGGGAYVLNASYVSIYVDASATTYRGMLMLDPDATNGTHADAVPIIESVGDFQVALGVDGDANGVVAAGEWLGDTAGELAVAPALPWNVLGSTTQPIVKALRVTLATRTSVSLETAAPLLGPIEDRSVEPVVANLVNPRYRTLGLVVAPRAFNVLE